MAVRPLNHEKVQLFCEFVNLPADQSVRRQIYSIRKLSDQTPESPRHVKVIPAGQPGRAGDRETTKRAGCRVPGNMVMWWAGGGLSCYSPITSIAHFFPFRAAWSLMTHSQNSRSVFGSGTSIIEQSAHLSNSSFVPLLLCLLPHFNGMHDYKYANHNRGEQRVKNHFPKRKIIFVHAATSHRSRQGLVNSAACRAFRLTGSSPNQYQRTSDTM